MDITQIKYLLTVVDNNYNLTKSAEVLHVSQPAISKAIKDIEFKMGTPIFNRKKGRIVGLTKYGSVLLDESKKVYEQYNEMVVKMNQISQGNNGTVRLGIAPVIISTVFNEALIDFIKENPGIQLKLIEKGAYELQKMLVLGECDLAAIVSPATIKGIYEEQIYSNTVRIWYNKDHRFNHYPAERIPFSEIEKEKIVTLTDDFMVTFQLNKKFRGNRLRPNYFLQTSSWDLVLNLVAQDPNLIGILAAPIGKNYNDGNVLSKEMDPIFPWKISLFHTMNSVENPTVDFTRKWMINFFKK